MINDNDISLDEVMGSKPNDIIDLRNGKIEPINPSNDDNVTDQNSDKVVKVIQTGPVDTSTIKPMDTKTILPTRVPGPNKMEEDLMSALDAAVEKEKKSISERMDAIIEMQEQELESTKYNDDNDLEEFDFRSNNLDINNNHDEDYNNEEDNDEEDEYDFNSISTTPNKITSNLIDIEEKIDYAEDNNTAHSIAYMDNDPEFLIDISSDNKDYKEETNIKEISSNFVLDNEEIEDVKADIRTIKTEDISKDLNLYDDEDDKPTDSSSLEEQSSEDDDRMIEELKKQIKDKTEPIRKNFDISKFKINKKSIDAQKVMKMAIRSHQTIADWIMYDADRPISMTGLSGPEILKLDPSNSNRTRLNTFRDIYRIVYDHVYDGNKPEFETWLKQTYFSDIDHIYFALFMATFGNNNFFHYECPNCKKVFIKDIAKIEDMIVYADDETKSKVRAILKKDSTSPSKDEYDIDIVQISDQYAFGLRKPSIWSVIIETATLSDNFIDKYSDLIDVITYIDGIYYIDAENETLIPIRYKIDENDNAKTTARRVKAFYEIISSLDSNDYFKLLALIADYRKDSNKVTYIVPGATCPDCATEIPANTDITPESMVFMRHRLAAIGNT